MKFIFKQKDYFVFKKRYFFALLLFFLVVLLKFYGSRLDLQAERYLSDYYKVSQSGYLEGCEPKEYKNGGSNALILFHGKEQCSSHLDLQLGKEVFDEGGYDLDVYIPTLPYHGRRVENLKFFNINDVEKFIEGYITRIAIRYDTVTIAAHSMSGLVVLSLMNEDRIPSNVKVVTVAPAVNINGNNIFSRGLLFVYEQFRDYCDLDILSCPVYPMHLVAGPGEDIVRQVTKLPINSMAVVRGVLGYESNNTDLIEEVSKPFVVMFSEDDFLMDVELVERQCNENVFCDLHLFPSGKHLVHWSDHAEEVIKFVLDYAKND